MSFADKLEKYIVFKERLKAQVERQEEYIEDAMVKHGMREDIQLLRSKYFYDVLFEVKEASGKGMFTPQVKEDLFVLRGQALMLSIIEDLISEFEYKEDK